MGPRGAEIQISEPEVLLRQCWYLSSLEEEPLGLEVTFLRKGCLRTAVVSKAEQDEDGSRSIGKAANGAKLLRSARKRNDAVRVKTGC